MYFKGLAGGESFWDSESLFVGENQLDKTLFQIPAHSS